MSERPILFSGPMVRAILDGRKTQTRRPVTPQPFARPEFNDESGLFDVYAGDEVSGSIRSPYGIAGDRLWVREAWRTTSDGGRADDMPPRDLQPHVVWYEADGVAPSDECVGKCRPSMFMPRWASRITLEVTDVRVERLNSISEQDSIAEGIERHYSGWRPYTTMFYEADGVTPANYLRDPRESYRQLWDSLNAERGHGWDVNPWVWVVEFRRV